MSRWSSRLSYGGGRSPLAIAVGWVTGPTNLVLSVDGSLVTAEEVVEGIGGSGVLRATVTDADDNAVSSDYAVNIPAGAPPPEPEVSPVTAFNLTYFGNNEMAYSASPVGYEETAFFPPWQPVSPTFAEQYEIDNAIPWDGMADLVSADVAYHDVYYAQGFGEENPTLVFTVKSRGAVIQNAGSSDSGNAGVSSVNHDGETATITFALNLPDFDVTYDGLVVAVIDLAGGQIQVRLHIKSILLAFG